MEGPVFIHGAWLLSAVCIWLYRRYVATVAERSAAFESYCRARPLLARITVTPGSEAELARRFAAQLGARAETIPTLAGWPWVVHVLKVELRTVHGALELDLVGCRGLRVQERRLPALTELLLDFMASARGEALSCWLCAGAYREVTEELAPEQGWRLILDAPRKHPVEPWLSPPVEARVA